MTAAAEEQLQGALRAVRITSATTFSWFGDLSSNIPAATRRSMSTAAMRDFLCYQLKGRLYSDFYCKGFATPADKHRAVGRRTPTTLFVQTLSAANTGTGSREGGWIIENIGSDVFTASRDGLRLWISRTDIHADEQGILLPAEARAVRLPKELLKLSPGFYIALGNEGLVFEPGQEIVRLYWNLHAKDAPSLLRSATRLLNDEHIPFRLKVVNDPLRYDRCDAGVLYIQCADYERALPAIRKVLAEISGGLKPATPVFTKVLAPGLSLAEEPATSGDSFGMDRCRILSEAIVRMQERNVDPATMGLTVVEEVFRENGIDPAKPYLNAASQDRYVF